MRGDSYEGGCMGTRGARVWIFLGFVMGFAAVIASCSILFTVYINRGKLICFYVNKQREASYNSLIHSFDFTLHKNQGFNFLDVKSPGVSLFLQNVFICIASIIFKFGRSEDVWG